VISEKDVYVEVGIYTTKYLGREDVAVQLLNLLLRNGAPYAPEKWGVDARPRYVIDLDDLSPILEEWLAPKEFKSLLFARKRPAPAEIWLNIDRFERNKFNRFDAFIFEKYFKKTGQEKELLGLITDLCAAMTAVYGYIAHKTQESRQSPILTPAERLPGIYWANFFGGPYIDFFGREKLLATPCYEAREINENLILLLTAESPLQPEMLENDDIPDLIKGYLNRNAFAGPRFPDEPCDVPEFDFSDVRTKPESFVVEAVEQKLNHIAAEFEAKGYKVINRSQDQLIFQGEDNLVVSVNPRTESVSLDLTGKDSR
jgi:hypothetical protein